MCETVAGARKGKSAQIPELCFEERRVLMACLTQLPDDQGQEYHATIYNHFSRGQWAKADHRNKLSHPPKPGSCCYNQHWE